MSADQRPVLMGMCNPYGDSPEHALYPLPERATGWRVWYMLHREVPEVGLHDYADGFDRRNLLVGEWNRADAVVAAGNLISSLMGRHVVLFGAAVRDSFRFLSRTPTGHVVLGHPWTDEGDDPTHFYWVPHPSGMNRWYNDYDNASRVGRFLARLWRGERGMEP